MNGYLCSNLCPLPSIRLVHASNSSYSSLYLHKIRKLSQVNETKIRFHLDATDLSRVNSSTSKESLTFSRQCTFAPPKRRIHRKGGTGQADGQADGQANGQAGRKQETNLTAQMQSRHHVTNVRAHEDNIRCLHSHLPPVLGPGSGSANEAPLHPSSETRTPSPKKKKAIPKT